VVNIALPAIGRDLDADAAGLQWTINGYALSLAALIQLGGSLGDRSGRRCPARHAVVTTLRAMVSR
jgi:MFS family permease